ncbi:MAG: hypothetical protein LBP21_08070 [Synergistaceae bacterium]|jgi:hypothetical protein|nr:hypothetical protein [Synergistaceae bacterium]
MKFINTEPSSTFAEFFTDIDFKGDKKKLERGEYGISAIDPSGIKSLKASEFATVTFFERAGGPGKSKSFTKDAPKLGLNFTPAYIAVESHVKAYKGGSVAAEFLKGEYEISELTKFDKLSVPRGFYLAFVGNKNDGNAVHFFENEEYKIDDRIKSYSKALILPLDNKDISLNFKSGDALSDEDLMAVAGGYGCLKQQDCPTDD